MILAVSMEQQPEPQQEAALSSLSCKAMALYFSRTMSFICSVVSILYILILRYYDGLDQKKCGGIILSRLSAAVVCAFVGGEQGADLFLIQGPGLRLDAIANTRAFDGPLDQAGILQLLQMLGYGWLRQPQLFDQVAVDTGIGLYQVLNNGDPRRMGQGLHHGGKFVLLVGEYFGFSQPHSLIVSLQYYDKMRKKASFCKKIISPLSFPAMLYSVVCPAPAAAGSIP